MPAGADVPAVIVRQRPRAPGAAGVDRDLSSRQTTLSGSTVLSSLIIFDTLKICQIIKRSLLANHFKIPLTQHFFSPVVEGGRLSMKSKAPCWAASA